MKDRSGIVLISLILIMIVGLLGPLEVEAQSKAWQARWEDIRARARSEGEMVVIAGGSISRNLTAFFDHFGKKFGIKVTVSTGTTSPQVNRVLAERTRRVYTVDVAMISGDGIDRLADAKALTPAMDVLFLPDVLNFSNWLMKEKFLWVDSHQKYNIASNVRHFRNLDDVYYNTKAQADIDKLESWRDLLNPKWKRRIAVDFDPAQSSRGIATNQYAVLGPEWLRRLIKEQEPSFLGAEDTRGSVDGLIRGSYHIMFSVSGGVRTDVNNAAKAGLPVSELKKTLKEGGRLEAAGHGAVFDKAPHPHAAQLFLNWLFSREGQTAFAELTLDPRPRNSLRIDVPQGRVTAEDWEMKKTFGAEQLFSPTDPSWIKTEEESRKWMLQIHKELRLYGQ